MINVAGAANESTMFYESMISEAPIQGAHDDKDKKIKEFSRGMKMKLSIAVALSHGAKLLILE